MAWFTKLACALGVAGIAGTALSCADNNQTLFIRQMQALSAPECIPTADPTALVIASGLLDVGLNTNYIVFPLIGSQLLGRGDPKTSRSEPNRIQVNGAEIRLVDAQGRERAFYSVIANGIVDPTASADATYNVAVVELIPPSIGLSFRNELKARGVGSGINIQAIIRVFGKTLGGTEVESGDYTFPMEICYGCSVFIPAEAVDKGISGPNCKGSAAGGTGTGRLVCRVGQDVPTDCRACQGSVALCTPCDADDDCTAVGGRCNTAVQLCEN